MKKIIIYSVMSIAVMMNVYLVFIWSPEEFIDNVESKSVIYTYKPTYTFDKEEVIRRLSGDKGELKNILGRMSVFDMECVKSYLNKGEEEEMKKAFSIMKRRLSNDDYRKVKEIFGEFIDIRIIEEV